MGSDGWVLVMSGGGGEDGGRNNGEQRRVWKKREGGSTEGLGEVVLGTVNSVPFLHFSSGAGFFFSKILATCYWPPAPRTPTYVCGGSRRGVVGGTPMTSPSGATCSASRTALGVRGRLRPSWTHC